MGGLKNIYIWDRTKPEACLVGGRDHGSWRLGRRRKPVRLNGWMIKSEGSHEDLLIARRVGRIAAGRCS